MGEGGGRVEEKCDEMVSSEAGRRGETRLKGIKGRKERRERVMKRGKKE